MNRVINLLPFVFLSFGLPALANTSNEVLPAELVADRVLFQEALQKSNPRRAVEIIRPWVQKRPADASLANDYALALAQLGQLDAAREALEKGLAADPDTAILLANLREILTRQAAVSYAKAMGKRAPATQLALKSSPQFDLAPLVVAQAAPRKDARVEVSVSPPAARNVKPTAPDLAAILASAPVEGKPPPPLKGVESRGQADVKLVEVDEKPRSAGAASARTVSEEVIDATKKWAKDWSSRDFQGYLSHYSEQFKSARFATRKEWEDFRRPRVDRPDPISVELSDFKVRALAGGKAEIRFRQRFDSRNLKLSTVRKVIWQKESDGWRILEEDNR